MFSFVFYSFSQFSGVFLKSCFVLNGKCTTLIFYYFLHHHTRCFVITGCLIHLLVCLRYYYPDCILAQCAFFLSFPLLKIPSFLGSFIRSNTSHSSVLFLPHPILPAWFMCLFPLARRWVGDTTLGIILLCHHYFLFFRAKTGRKKQKEKDPS